jgi:hypothetical protein
VKVTTTPTTDSEIEILTALGFGPDTLLTSEPKLFMDGQFLSALLVELEDELESLGARRALFQIGLLYGFRDALRIAASAPRDPESAVAESTLLAIDFGHQCGSSSPGKSRGIEITGSWPERYEADARLSRLGPDEHPCCALSAGYTSGWFSGSMDMNILVVETECASRGDGQCKFSAREVEVWSAENDPANLTLLPKLPLDKFRDIGRGFSKPFSFPDDPQQTPLNFDASVVHVWGPVMVLPFTNIDQALHTVEMLGRDPDTSEVRAVVVDLQGEGLDEGFAAAALEQILETIEAWGAEAILTNVSPLAEPAVAELEVRHLLLRKDLPEAISAGFQIAEAQRHLL